MDMTPGRSTDAEFQRDYAKQVRCSSLVALIYTIASDLI